ncbi:MAG: ABC transporter substrate-binding protein, partial [Pigmentiphaga sp.]
VQEKYGLRYELLIFNDATAVILAMDLGEIDLGNLAAQHVVRAIDQGMELVLVAGWGGGYNVLMAGNQIELERDDFKGFKALVDQRKAERRPVRIGVPTGSQQHMHLVYFLDDIGVDAERDVQIMNIPFPTLPRSLDSGEVDFVMSLAPFAAMILDGGMGSLFHHLYGGDRGQWEIGFAVPRSMIEKNPELVQKIVDSHVEALNLFKDDLSMQVKFETDEGSFPKSIVEIVQGEFLNHSYRIDLEDIQRTARMMHELGWTRADHSQAIEDYVDFSFLEKATGESREQLSQF